LKNLKSCTFLFVFFLILGSCGSGVAVYEPGQESGLDNPAAGGGNLDDASLSEELLTAIFEDGEETVANKEDCPKGTTPVPIETKTAASVTGLATRVKALNAIKPSYEKYDLYKYKVVDGLKELFLSSLGLKDDEVEEIIQILTAHLSDSDYKLLMELADGADGASNKAFNDSDKSVKKSYSCTPTAGYKEKYEKGEAIVPCDLGVINDFDKAIEDKELSLEKRCKGAEQALSQINSSSCMQYGAKKARYIEVCVSTVEQKVGISSTIYTGDRYVKEGQMAGFDTAISGLDYNLPWSCKWYTASAKADAEFKLIDHTGCGYSINSPTIALDGTKYFFTVSNGERTSKSNIVTLYVSAVENPADCSVHQSKFDAAYEESACSDITFLKSTMADSEKLGCDVSSMAKIVAGCEVLPPPNPSDVCSDYLNEIYAISDASGCGDLAAFDVVIAAAEKSACDTTEMTDIYAACKK